jgi:hypothetical protein
LAFAASSIHSLFSLAQSMLEGDVGEFQIGRDAATDVIGAAARAAGQIGAIATSFDLETVATAIGLA